MKSNSPQPKRPPPPDPHHTQTINIIKKHLKVNILQRLAQLGVGLDSPQAVEWLNLSCYDHYDQQPLPQGKEN
jgi:hypothetical protein